MTRYRLSPFLRYSHMTKVTTILKLKSVYQRVEIIVAIVNPLPDDKILNWSKLKPIETNCRRHFKAHLEWKTSAI